MSTEHIHFVTGRLAENALRGVLEDLAPKVDWVYSVGVMPITVAALMTPAWIARHIEPPAGVTRVLLPGHCGGDLTPLVNRMAVPVELGPKDLRKLPAHFDQGSNGLDRQAYDIEILAEINHAPRLDRQEILTRAADYVAQGADVIDLGCEPGEPWSSVADCVKALRDDGRRVSIDSLNPAEIAPAVRAGAELVLSVNSTNRIAAEDWGCEVVAIPDDFATLDGLDETVEHLAAAGVSLRLDPILEPIGCGFANSLGRYLEVRRRYPDAEVMMGIGNLTELSDADSAGINMLLLGFCQELGIRSVLTTAVINWARTSVRECDLARRLVFHAIAQGIPPKHLEPRLITLRDPTVPGYGAAFFDDLASRLKDHNYRLFAEGGQIHLVAAGQHLQDADPFRIFQRLLQLDPKQLDASHAFYLGYEMAKAVTALTLDKEYRQDEALDWGYLTIAEQSHRSRKHGKT